MAVLGLAGFANEDSGADFLICGSGFTPDILLVFGVALIDDLTPEIVCSKI